MNDVTISLPKGLNEKVEREAKKRKFKSKSDFLLFVLRGWEKQVTSVIPKKIKEVKLLPDEKIAIDRAKDDIKHGRFISHEKFMKFLNH